MSRKKSQKRTGGSATEPSWITAGVRAQGRSHEMLRLPCQDALLSVCRAEGALLVAADGAGSEPNSSWGAEAAVSAVTVTLNELRRRGWQGSSYRLAMRLQTAVSTHLRRVARQRGVSIYTLACTLVYVWINGPVVYAGNLGDGVALALSRGSSRVLIPAQRGSFANITTFVTSRDASRRWRTWQGPSAQFDGFAVCTDGVADVLVERGTQRVADAVTQVASWFTPSTAAAAEAALYDTFLLSHVRRRTMDDCSFGLAVRVRTPV